MDERGLVMLLQNTTTLKGFFRTYWEEKILHVIATDPSRYQDPKGLLDFSIHDVDKLIREARTIPGIPGSVTRARFGKDVKLVRRKRMGGGESLTEGFEPPAPHGNVSLETVHAMFNRGQPYPNPTPEPET